MLLDYAPVLYPPAKPARTYPNTIPMQWPKEPVRRSGQATVLVEAFGRPLMVTGAGSAPVKVGARSKATIFDPVAEAELERYLVGRALGLPLALIEEEAA